MLKIRYDIVLLVKVEETNVTAEKGVEFQNLRGKTLVAERVDSSIK